MEQKVISNDNSLLESIDSRLQVLEQLFADKIQYDAQKEELFDRLYEDAKKNRLELVEQYHKGLYLDLLMLYDNLVHKMAELANSKEHVAFTAVEFIRDELLEVLSRREIEIIQECTLEDPKKRKIIGVVATDDPNEDNKIMKIVFDGFTLKDMVLRQASVIVAKFSAKEDTK